MILGRGCSKESLAQFFRDPFTGTAKLHYIIPDNSWNARVTVYDMLGSMVVDIPLETKRSSIQLDLPGNKSGIYFVYLLDGKEVLVTKKAVLVK